MSFSKVIYDPGQTELAKVNRSTGTLYLNSKIWQGLPRDQQEFVLFHEDGHLTMQTASEFKANEYAIQKFAPVRTLTNGELAQRIIVMRDAFTKANTSGFAIGSLVGGALSGVSSLLSVVGLGNSATKETSLANRQLVGEQAKAQVAVIEAETKQKLAASEAFKQNASQYVLFGILGAVTLIIILAIFFISRK